MHRVGGIGRWYGWQSTCGAVGEGAAKEEREDEAEDEGMDAGGGV